MALSLFLSRSHPVSTTTDQQIRFCTSSDGVGIAYATIGSGPPLVKAANWLSHLEVDGKSPVWRHWIRELSRHNTLVRYDERGCGLSDWNVERVLARGLGPGSRGGGRRARAGAVSAARHLPGRPHRHRVCDPASGAREPSHPVRELRPGGVAPGALGSGPRRARAHAPPDPGGLGQGPSRLPSGLHQPVHPRRHDGADAVVQRAPAGVGDARECRPHVRRVQHSGCAWVGARSPGSDPGAARHRRHADSLRRGSPGGLTHPWCSVRADREPEPSHPRVGAGVASFRRGSSELPRHPA